MAVECVANSLVCPAAETRGITTAGERALLDFENNPNDIKNYLALKKYALDNYDSIIARVNSPAAKTSYKLLAAVALVAKEEKTSNMDLLSMAAIVLKTINDCCFVRTTTILQGQIRFRSGDWQMAKAIFEGAHMAQPQLYFPSYYLMVMALVDGQRAEAIDYAADLKPLYDNRSEAAKVFSEQQMKLVDAETFLNKTYLESGRTILEGLIQQNPLSAPANYLLGKSYQEFAELDKAMRYYKVAVETGRLSLDPIDRQYGQKAAEKMAEIALIKEQIAPLLKPAE